MPHMQWQGESTNVSTNQVRGIGHSNISWNNRKWHYKHQQNHIRTCSINLKSLQYDLIEDNLKKLKTEIKKSLEEKYKKIQKKINNRNEWQKKTSCGYINPNWSFKLVDSTSIYRISIRII